MKVLMLSRDKKIFEEGSAVRARMIEYGKLFDHLYIHVLSNGKYNKEKISENVTVSHVGISGLVLVIHRILKNIPKDIDLVTTQDPFETGYIAYRIAKKLHIPLQLQVHTDFLSSHFRKESIKNFIRYIVSKITIPKAACIRVVSKRIEDSLAELGIKSHESRTTILPIFVDAQKIKDAQPALLSKQYDFTILWVGRFEKEKNCSLAIKAFSEFAKKYPNAGLVIMGDGSERKKLELQAKNYKLQANVMFLGWKNDIAGYYESADVLLVTSWYEGYGMNMVEARIADIPVVAPDVGVAEEVGAYITDHTSQGIAHVLMQLHERRLPMRDKYQYPYENKEQYLQLCKQSFERCLRNLKK